jgi:hypothetical protein
MGGSGGGGISPGPGLPGSGGDCPRRFLATLVDVPQSGNVEYALSLARGSELEVAVIDANPAVLHQGRRLGMLPPTYKEVAACIELGWKYSASLSSAAGTRTNPKIRVAVVGVPG